LDPDDASAYETLSVALQRLGRAKEAKSKSALAARKRELVRQRERAAVLRAVLVPRGGNSSPSNCFDGQAGGKTRK